MDATKYVVGKTEQDRQDLLQYPDMAAHVFWTGEIPPFHLQPGGNTMRIVYSDHSESNLCFRNDIRLSQINWLSVGFLEVVLHNCQSAVSMTPTEWVAISTVTCEIEHMLRSGQEIAKSRHWRKHSMYIGGVVIAPSTRETSMWISKNNMAIQLNSCEFKVLKSQMEDTRSMCLMQSKYNIKFA